MADLLNNEYGYVYGIESLGLIKVGVSRDIEARLEAMRALNPHGCECIFYRRTYAPYTLEKRIHELLADKALGREWFRASLAEVRAAAKTARGDVIRAEREMQRRFKAALEKPRKVARCVNPGDRAARIINGLRVGSKTHIGEYEPNEKRKFLNDSSP